MNEKKKYDTAKCTLLAMRDDVALSLGLEFSKRFDACFDLAVTAVAWSMVDGAHTKDTVLPYLCHLTMTHIAGGAFTHLETA